MRQRGDTIVEVLFAVTVFSLVAVGGLSVMNQGTAMAQRSLEIGLVRDQMDAQADALRYLHAAYLMNFSDTAVPSTTTLWQDTVLKHAVTKAQSFSDIATGGTCNIAPTANAAAGLPYSVSSDATPFVLDIQKLDPGSGNPAMTNIVAAETYAQVRYPSVGSVAPTQPEGMWVQPVYVRPTATALGYIDFHIQACWFTPGQSAPVTLGTIVRLYEPKR